MNRARLRPAHSPERLAEIYAKPHDHRQWRDHRLRVAATLDVARWMVAADPAVAAADLSCGNGAILRTLAVENPLMGLHLGDFAPGHQYTGPIEETVEQIPNVDLFVCSETIEHLDDPDVALKAIRAKTRMLILSTPVDAWGDPNEEHYWAWSRPGVEAMLTAAGFETVVYSSVDFRMYGNDCYQFGIWGCR